MNRNFYIIIIFLSLLQNKGIANSILSDTMIGNGGDILSSYLEASRKAMIMTLHDIASHPENADTLCKEDKTLSSAQKKDCQDFIIETMQEILALNSIQKKTKFTLKYDEIYLTFPNGDIRQVAAATTSGPDGDIFFHYSSIQFLSPFHILQLMYHEFGHKVKYRNSFLDDFTTISSFPSNRDLLDVAGQSLAYYSQQRSIISQDFTLLDRFSCKISINNSRPIISNGMSKRLFLQRNDFDQYQVSLGKTPQDFGVSIEDSDQSTIRLEVIINEDQSCKEDPTSTRNTIIKLIRSYPRDVFNQPIAEDVILHYKEMLGFNPLCQTSTNDFFEIQFEDLKFSCKYIGAESVTKNLL